MTLPAVLQNTVKNLQTLRQASEPDVSDFQYLKMDKGGHWIYGADDIDLDLSGTYVFDPATYAQGFVAWDDGELLGERMASANGTPITRADLEDVGAAWNEQQAICLLGAEGQDAGVQLMYKVSSKGGKKAIGTLIDAVIERAKEGESDLCPVIQLSNDSYKHKKYGKIFTPIFNIVGWCSVEDAQLPEDEPEEVEEVEEEESKPVIKMRKRKRTA